MTPKLFVTGLALLAAGSLACSYVMPERSIDYNKGRVPVNLPSNIKSSEEDRDMDKETAVIVSVTDRGQFYLGTSRDWLNKDDLRVRLGAVLKDKTAPDTMVYIAASVTADYGMVIEVCDLIGMNAVSRVGLMVNRVGYNTPSRLTVELQQLPDPDEDLSQKRPNPLTLVASVASDLKVTLNTQDIGSVNDLSQLSNMLTQVFRQRSDNFALKPGYETRSDLPLEERIEKTLTIKAPKSIKYGDVVKVIDVARGAGARPIVLQLYDLAP